MTFIDSTADDGYRCIVDYKDGIYTVEIISPKGEKLSEQFFQTFTPTFGMDVADVAKANEIAEKLAVRLGAKPSMNPG